MKTSLTERKLAVLERIVSLHDTTELELVLDRLEKALPSRPDTKLSGWAYELLMQGMADTAAGKAYDASVGTHIIKAAIEKSKKGVHA